MGARRNKPETPEPEREEPDFGSSRRIARAWANAPEPWREVQAEQLNEAVNHLREHDDDHKADEAPAPAQRKRRFGLARIFSH